MPKNLWNSDKASAATGVEELAYRSNLLGADRTVCNWGGGNTSMKSLETDFRGRPIRTMWVKGSGSDLASATGKSFTALALDDVLPLFERETMSDEEMVAYLTQCMIDPKHPRMSIETLLHAFLPFTHVDHAHPDAIISICTSSNGRQVAEEIWGDRFVWVPYIRPGFTLSKMIAQGVRDNPKAELVLMEKHGLVTWGHTSEECYRKTIDVIAQAEAYIAAKVEQLGNRLFGGQKHTSLAPADRRAVAAKIMPTLRGLVGADARMILNFDDSDDVLRFVNSVDAVRLGEVGAACPDHLVHTKRTPLLIDWNPGPPESPSAPIMGDRMSLPPGSGGSANPLLIVGGAAEVREHAKLDSLDRASINISNLLTALQTGVADYCADYHAYFDANSSAGDSMSSPAPRIILIPGVGMITTGKSKAMAEVSAALYHRAVAVMTGSTALGEFVSLSAAESFAIEYWPLELYKLTLAPPEVEFSRRIALITGGGGGIGSETARLLAKEGAHVVLADINFEAAKAVADEIDTKHGVGRALAVRIDVTDEASVAAAFQEAALAYGGIDVLVNNAGLATSSPFDETTFDEWNRNMDVLGAGYFLCAREAFRVMKQQTKKLGGAMVFVGSKNSIYAGKNAAAYSAAKAAELHLARCIAAEGGDYGIRVNTVLPDAVLQGSTIWNSAWRAERAAAYGVAPEELEEYYRKRTVLGVNVAPADIAAAIAFLASSKAAKTTGCAVTVDGGVAAAFTR